MWVQNPNVVKNEAVNFFLNRFTEQHYFRPTLDGVQFPSINQRQREDLIAPFSDMRSKKQCGVVVGTNVLGLMALISILSKNFGESSEDLWMSSMCMAASLEAVMLPFWL